MQVAKKIESGLKYPPRVDTEGFDKETLSEVALAKMQELNGESMSRERDALIKEDFAYWLLNNFQEYSVTWFNSQIYLYKLEGKREKTRLWTKYWERVGGLYKKPVFKNGFSDTQIQAARGFPIQELVGEFRKVGSKYFTLCPFHSEKHPSFCVFEDNSWHCFGCNQHGGGAIDFLMRKEELDFPEAVRRLL